MVEAGLLPNSEPKYERSGRNAFVIVAVAPTRMFISLIALLSIRLKYTFSLRRLSPDAESVLPSRLRLFVFSLVDCSGGGVSDFSGFSAAETVKRTKSPQVVKGGKVKCAPEALYRLCYEL